MRNLIRSLLVTLLLVGPIAAITLPGTSAQDLEVRSVNDGVYSEKQAKRGKRVQRRACFRCHIDDFYKGSLIDSWAGNTLGALMTHIANTMPQDRPSSLKPRQYADFMAYLLQLNGFPAGAEDLPSDDSALAKIRIERSKK